MLITLFGVTKRRQGDWMTGWWDRWCVNN